MKKGGTTIKRIITQFVLIVFSVVLGLYLSERIEDRKKRKEAKSNLRLMSDHWNEVVSREEQLLYYYQVAEKKLGLKGDKKTNNKLLSDKNRVKPSDSLRTNFKKINLLI